MAAAASPGAVDAAWCCYTASAAAIAKLPPLMRLCLVCRYSSVLYVPSCAFALELPCWLLGDSLVS